LLYLHINFNSMEFKTLEDVRMYLDNIPLINKGGCGIASLVMYRWLIKKNLIDKDTKFIFLYSYSSKSNYISNKRKEKNNTNFGPVAPSHVVLFYNKKCLDSDSEKSLKEYREEFPYKHEVKSENFLINAINAVNSWNFLFDRRFVKKIQRDLNIDLSDIKIEFEFSN